MKILAKLGILMHINMCIRLRKNHFYKVFEHSCVATVCENNQLSLKYCMNSFEFSS